MSRAGGRTGGQAAWVATHPGDATSGLPIVGISARLSAIHPARPTCNRCGFEVRPRAWGCKNPCANCGTVYPLGDCSD